MKIGFFEIEDWEIDYLKNQLTSAELFFYQRKVKQGQFTPRKKF